MLGLTGCEVECVDRFDCARANPTTSQDYVCTSNRCEVLVVPPDLGGVFGSVDGGRPDGGTSR